MLNKIVPDFQLKDYVRSWLKEDIPNFDIGAIAVTSNDKEGQIVVKEPCVLAGVPFITEVFSQVRCSVDWRVEEGTKINSVPCTVGVVSGPVIQILQGERLALNILSRACGIATYAKKLVDIATLNKWKGSVVGTRKTTPGFRLVEKYAMLVGGAGPHRYDLSSMVMLKDNHIDASHIEDKEKAILQAVAQTRKVAGHHMKIEVESRNEKEAMACAAAGADIILLDNFNAKVACSVAQKLKSRYPRLLVEASGSINESNIVGYMGSGIDILSTSRLCNGYSVVDVSMKLKDAPPSTVETCRTVNTGVKRSVPWASDGETAANSNVNKNGDSAGGSVDVDLPEKRRRTEDNSDAGVDVSMDEETNAKTDQSNNEEKKAAVTPPNQPKQAVDAKVSPSVSPATKTAPHSASPKSQTTPNTNRTSLSSNGKSANVPGRPMGNIKSSPGIAPRPTTSAPVTKPSTPVTTTKSTFTTRSEIQQKNNSPIGRSYGNTNNTRPGGYNQNQRSQSGGIRTQQQQNRYGRQDNSDNSRYRQNDRYQNPASQSIQRPQPPQPVGRGIVGALPGSAGPLHQQLALQAAANRAAGMPIRPGNSLGMVGRQGMNANPNRGGYGGGPGGRSGPNALPLSGPHDFNLSGRGKSRDWEYRY